MWEEGTRFAYVIVDRASGKVIGDFHLKQVDTRGRRMEFGHALAPSAWGTGITHETIDAVARAARAMGYRLWAKVEVSNIRSWKSLENRGAVFVGTRSFNVHGEKERMRVYELPE
jgi:RimJ/RimL family protein N-acetyltransferase